MYTYYRSTRPHSCTRSTSEISIDLGSSRTSIASGRSRSRSTSRLSYATLDKAASLLAAKGSGLLSTDRKILELMVSRYGKQIEIEEEKDMMREEWEEEKTRMQLKKAEEEMARRKSLIHARQLDDLQRKMRKAYIEQEELGLIHEKEQALLVKAEKWRRLAEEQEKLREEYILSRRYKSLEKKKLQELRFIQQQAEDRKLKTLLAQLMEHSLIQAAHRRHSAKLQRRMILNETNAEEVNRHMENKAEVEAVFREKLDKLQELLQEKEEKFRINYESTLQSRVSSAKQSKQREREKLGQVQEIQERLNAEYREWQNELKEYRSLVERRATTAVHKRWIDRQEDVRRERTARLAQHERRMHAILNEEHKKTTLMKAKLSSKDVRCERIARQKEQEILKSRAAACASAQLKEQLSGILQDATFDKKARRAEMECRLMNRKPLVHCL